MNYFEYMANYIKSGGSGTMHEIKLNDYGIDVFGAILDAVQSSSGKYSETVTGTEPFWEEVEKNPNCILLGDYLGQGNLRLNPAIVLQYDNGACSFIAINASTVSSGALVTGSIALARDSFSDSTLVGCVTTTTML